MKQTSS